MFDADGEVRPVQWLCLGGLGIGVQTDLHLVLQYQDLSTHEGVETRIRARGADGKELLVVSINLSREWGRVTEGMGRGKGY